MLVLLGGGCSGNGADDETTPSPAPSETAPAGVPSPSATPDPLGPPPSDAAGAHRALDRYFAGRVVACADELSRRWDVICTTGDVDGDAIPDTVMLVPLAGPGLRSTDPAVVFVRRATAGTFDRFPTSRTEADDSPSGRAIFAVVDRTGDARPEVTYLSKGCTASTCNALVEMQSWDGTAWRDIGPSDGGIVNVESVAFTGSGAATVLTVRGGHLSSIGAGPSRARTVTYAFDGSRYSVVHEALDPPEYLYHAIVDADTLFTLQKFPEAVAAYQAAIEDPKLKDWKLEVELKDGRAQLHAYALFRIAVATAADGQNPNLALDAVVTSAQEEVFQKAAVAFRQGYQSGGTPQAGCLAATNFLSLGDVPQLIDEMFDYGTANPGKEALDICPL